MTCMYATVSQSFRAVHTQKEFKSETAGWPRRMQVDMWPDRACQIREVPDQEAAPKWFWRVCLCLTTGRASFAHCDGCANQVRTGCYWYCPMSWTPVNEYETTWSSGNLWARAAMTNQRNLTNPAFSALAKFPATLHAHDRLPRTQIFSEIFPLFQGALPSATKWHCNYRNHSWFGGKMQISIEEDISKDRKQRNISSFTLTLFGFCGLTTHFSPQTIATITSQNIPQKDLPVVWRCSCHLSANSSAWCRVLVCQHCAPRLCLCSCSSASATEIATDELSDWCLMCCANLSLWWHMI